MIYRPQTPADASALTTAASRGRVRSIVPGVFTDDLDTPSSMWVQIHLMSVLATLYPDWHVSHSTAALGHAVNGVAFISGPAANLKTTELPGVRVKRIRQMQWPEIVTVDTGSTSKRTLSGEEEPVLVRMSSPLQAVFEVLRRDARQPERTLTDAQIQALIEQLSATDRLRAQAFAERNGLTRELARFRELERSLRATVPIRRDAQPLDAYFYNYRVGRLTELAGAEIRFEYDASWPIELSGLPFTSAGPAYEGRTLPAFFDNLLPEGWAESRLRAVYKIARDDAYALIRATPKYLSNLTLRPPNLTSAEITLDVLSASVTELVPARAGLARVTEEIGAAPDTREFWLELRRRGATGLSGVQAKLPVHLFGSAEDPHIALGHVRNTSTHILKLQSREFADLVQNEWTTMELARRVGLNVAEVRQAGFQEESKLEQPALLIERFDLPHSLERIELLPLLEDAASLLGLRRFRKYETSLEQVADVLRARGVDEQGMASFFDHVLFSWVCGNGDLHAKNISVIHDIRPGRFGLPPNHAGIRYSPLYDLVNTRLVLRDDQFALPVNGKRDNLRRKDFATLADRWGWSRKQTNERIERIVTGVAAHLDDVIGDSELTEPDRRAYALIVRANLGRM